MKQKYITVIVLATVLSSCKDNEIFEAEMYKNEVALISTNYYNTFQEVVPLTGGEVIGYVAASAGGSHATTKDLVIQLEHDEVQLDLYNRSLFDFDDKLYAKQLPASKYDIVDNKITIKPGERTGRATIKLRPDGLSPDSTYFIGLKATDVSGVEINPKKNRILYQVVIKNAYASQAENEFYNMTGLLDGIVTAGSKKLFPLTSNSVRVAAGNESFESKIDIINKVSIVLEVSADNKVTIKPYKDILVTQLNDDPLYPNTFKQETSFGRTFNSFLLSYSFTIGNKTRIMKEELRIEVKK